MPHGGKLGLGPRNPDQRGMSSERQRQATEGDPGFHGSAVSIVIRNRVGWIVAFVSSFVLACSVTAGHSPTYKIATHPVTDLSRQAIASGILAGEANSDGTACLWLGEDSSRTAIIWPAGYRASPSPLTVYDDHGKKVGAVGQKITLVGGAMPAPSNLTGCMGFDQAWFVGQVLGSD